MEIKEIFKDIKGYPEYQISNLGRVWSIKTQRYLKGSKNHGGYQSVCIIANNGKSKREYIHRLVALNFIPNPKGLPEVNHKDECKTNNCVDNLEWISRIDNNNYGTRNERSSKPVYCVELDKTFYGASQAARELGLNRSHICDCCRGRLKTTGGYHWLYVGGDSKECQTSI